MRPMMCSGLESESSSSGCILKGISDPKIRMSEEEESTEDITDSNGGLGDEDTSNCCSCASSFSDDSGFSSDIDVKEYISDIVLRTRCDFNSKGEKIFDSFDDESEKIKKGNCDDKMVKEENCDDDDEIVKEWNGCDNEDEIVRERNCGCSGEHERTKIWICGQGEMVQKLNEDVNKVNCEFDNESDKVNFEFDDTNVNRMNTEVYHNTNNSQVVQLQYDKTADCSEIVFFKTSTDTIRDISLEKRPTVVVHRRHRSVDLSEAYKKNNINQDCSNKQADSSKSSVVSVGTSNLRATRRRRGRTQDLNNNDFSPRRLSSYFGKAPCKLQDCFHDQGLLSLVACVIYTLILVVVITALSIIVEALKSCIGIQNLKRIRRSIVLYRRSRMSTAAG